MNSQKFRWSKVYESSEEELVAFLAARTILARNLHVESGEQHEFAASDHEVTLWCAEGSFTVTVAEAAISMQPGDAVRIAPDTAYRLNAGIAGYICYFSPA